MDEKANRWNRFINEICDKELSELTPVQRKAVICYHYMNEMYSGGFGCYFDSDLKAEPDELYNALTEVGNKEYADNFREALLPEAEENEYEDADSAFNDIEPELDKLLEEYVENNKALIFV